MKALIQAHKKDRNHGIYSICSAHPLVLKAALLFSKTQHTPLLIESTSNQVNQDGGYTGMQPHQFKAFVYELAEQVNFPLSKIILGGDHLGPNCWQHLHAEEALAKSEQLIAAYVEAGFTKIHLDTSMCCLDDPTPLPDKVIAERAARLANVAEASASAQQKEQLCYVIGTEVPVPGGETHAIQQLKVSDSASVQQTIETHRIAFQHLNLNEAFQRVIAVVVQPGVEFDHQNIIHYQPDLARDLSQSIESTPFVFEAHSTDYQTAATLKQLVNDHFAILKVGPALTFALREALFALNMIEESLISVEKQSQLQQVMYDVMRNNPTYWEKYYQGHFNKQQLDLGFSLSDRIRYYWSDPRINHAYERLFLNLTQLDLPIGLVSQYLPLQAKKILAGELLPSVEAIIIDKIQYVIQQYHQACYSNNP